MQQIVLITISGNDRLGLTNVFAGILAKYDAALLDIGQAVVHNSLTFGLMVSIDEGRFDEVADAVKVEARRLDLSVHVSKVSESVYRTWIARQHRQRFIVTLLAPRISANQLAAIAQLFALMGLNIDIMDRLSGREAAARTDNPRMCIEFTVSGDAVDAALLRQSLLGLADEADFDVAVQEDSLFRRNRRLVVFDMDSTLIQMEVIDELARRAGVYEEVSAITQAAMRGEIDFQTSFQMRMRLLTGLKFGALEDVANNLPLTQGAHRLMRALKQLGYKTAILSGGFSYFAKKLQTELGFDYVHAHELEVRNGALTGNIIGDVIDGQRKAQLLREIAANEGIALEQTIAIGDGANDLPMLSMAGVGIAFHAKPLVRHEAKHSISLMGLDSVLYLLGIRDRHIDQD